MTKSWLYRRSSYRWTDLLGDKMCCRNIAGNLAPINVCAELFYPSEITKVSMDGFMKGYEGKTDKFGT